MAQIDIPARFTLQELQDILRKEDDTYIEGFHTIDEWSEMLGSTTKRMRMLIRRGQKLDCVDRVMVRRTNISGFPYSLAAFSFNLSKLEGSNGG